MTLDANGIEILVGDTIRNIYTDRTFKVQKLDPLTSEFIYIQTTYMDSKIVYSTHYEIVLEDATTVIKRLPV